MKYMIQRSTMGAECSYVSLAFDLPPDSGSIWNLLKDDIDSLGSHSQGDILVFLGNFVSESLVQIVASNLMALEESFLTIEYTLGRGNTVVPKAIVDGILEEAVEQRTPLAQFLGHVSELDKSSMDEEEMTTRVGRLSVGGVLRVTVNKSCPVMVLVQTKKLQVRVMRVVTTGMLEKI